MPDGKSEREMLSASEATAFVAIAADVTASSAVAAATTASSAILAEVIASSASLAVVILPSTITALPSEPDGMAKLPDITSAKSLLVSYSPPSSASSIGLAAAVLVCPALKNDGAAAYFEMRWCYIEHNVIKVSFSHICIEF